jgi:glutamine amidotransferase
VRDSSSKTVIVDYGMGNLRSVLRKCERVGKAVTVSAEPEVIASANKLILPGVGHFANGVKNLKESGIWEVLNHKVVGEQTPILGICLGMQLMAGYSEEGNIEGLGWIDAEVKRFTIHNRLKHRVPHMGWNTTVLKKESPLFHQLLPEMFYYFVHSYHLVGTASEDILTTTDYEYTFTSAVQKGNIYGTQFHPEKSHDSGEQMLRNFLTLI